MEGAIWACKCHEALIGKACTGGNYSRVLKTGQKRCFYDKCCLRIKQRMTNARKSPVNGYH